jgi:lipopolysaccharide/colanic/teichoic acid biosynthesis glycosyltransferase
MMRRLARVVLVWSTPTVVLALSKAHAVRHGYDLTSSARITWALVYIAALVLAAYAVGLPDLVRTRRSAYVASVAAAILAAGGLSAIQLVLGAALLPRFVVFGSAAILAPLYAALSRLCTDGDIRAADRDRVVVIADLDEAETLRDDLDRRTERPAQLVGVLSVGEAVTARRGDRPVAALVAQERATVVALSRAAQDQESIVAQVADLHLAGIRVRTLSLFYEEWLGKLPVTELERVSLMFDIGEIHRARYTRVTRVIDTGLAVVGCVVLALATPAVAIANRFGNRGPLLFRQMRVGKDGALFEVLKFRTMSPSTDAGPAEWTTEGDPRVTPFGRLLRRSHLDELPQVLNILRGDLAVVGPRPEQAHYVEELREKLPFYDLRHLVRPGLTGWAQVKYPYGADEADALEKLQYEFFYLRRQSVALDLRIVGRTIRSVLRREGR